MEIKEANLLTATEDYIVQQNSCVACKPQGLSYALVTAFPHANPYKDRKPIKHGGNIAIEADRAFPGTIIILGNGTNQRYVACLFAQINNGKPGEVLDSAGDRERYFADCLESLATQIPQSATLAFPYKIGCGLAGGKWPRYETILKNWCVSHPTLRVSLYKIE